jgi:uncharacterized membrane protein
LGQEESVAEETSKGAGFDAIRVVINLAGLMLGVGVVILIVASITV